MEETSIIALVREGNADAFVDIVEHYQAPIQRYLFRLTGNHELAQDLAQDTFIQAYKAILKTNADILFKAWLYRIATNNAYQSHRRKRLISFVPLSGLNKEEETSAEDWAEESNETMAIQEALRKVPKEQRSCLVLHLVEGFKYREIAETLNISEDAVRMRVVRGKEAFQQAYRGGEVK